MAHAFPHDVALPAPKARSYYSFCEGVASPDRLVTYAAEVGIDVLALCDRDVLAGVPEFVRSCLRNGVKPVVGCEFELRSGSHLTLLARNAEGYRNLLSVSTLASSAVEVNHGLLDGLTSDLVGVIRPSGSEREAEVRALCDLLGLDSLFTEMVAGADAEYVRRALSTSRWGPRPIATSCLSATCEPGLLLTRLARYSRKRPATALHRSSSPTGTGIFPGPSLLEMRTPAGLDHVAWRDSANLAREVWDSCAGVPVVPEGLPPLDPAITFPVYGASRQDESARLRYAAFSGARERGIVAGEGTARLEMELEVVTRRGMAGYFLILWDIVRFARNEGIAVGPGRGSAVGSLLAYCLGITAINPLDHGLLFERFLSEERKDLPDIDLDLGHAMRHKVLDYVERKYGRDRVIHQGIITRLGARGAIRAAGRALGTDPRIVDLVAKIVPQTRGPGGLSDSLGKYPEARGLPLDDERVDSLVQAALLLENLPTGFATHPSAIIITPGPAVQHLPLTVGAGGRLITQFDAETVSALGFPKFDLLGLRTLTLIQETLSKAERRAGQEPSIPTDDRETWNLIARGDTIGCFQLDSPGMREVLCETKPRSLGELAAALSIYRPGPWDRSAFRSYVARKMGREEMPPSHPLVRAVLLDTCGILLYQEQVLELARAVAGFSLGDAERMRRDLAKGLGDGWKQVFQDRARARGLGSPEAESIWDLLRRFSGYSFNKAHVTAYALISYQAAYLKAHHPEVYFPLLVASDSGHFSSEVYRLEARRMGVEVDPPREGFGRSGNNVKHRPAASPQPPASGESRLVGPIVSTRRQEDSKGRPMLQLLLRQGDELVPVTVPATVYARDVMEIDPAGVTIYAHRRSTTGKGNGYVAKRIEARRFRE